MSKPSAPEAPDPVDTAQASTSTNVSTAIANNMMGFVNQVTPDGSLTYDQTGTYEMFDEYTGATYDIPTYTATQTLTPEAQKVREATLAAQSNLADVAAERAGFLADYLPEAGVGVDEAAEAKLFEMGSQRLDPMFERRKADLETSLAQKGIVRGSEAWQREMDAFGQQQNDAYNQLALSGRAQLFDEAAYETTAPINQITALLSGSQVASPNLSVATPSAIPTTDVAGIIQQDYANQLGAYQQQMSSYNSLMGGLFGAGAKLGAAGLLM